MATNPLVIYLNDHLAGSRAALQLLDDMIESTRDTEDRAFLSALRAEIAADRDVLEDIIRRVSGAPSVVREMGGWIAEKLAQLKLIVDDPSNGPLRRLEALEILALGIEGKGSLWRALSLVAPSVPELAGVKFGDLVRRAAEQYARVEAKRIEAVHAAFTRRDVSATPPSRTPDGHPAA
jgi:hypothetical protein